MMTQEKLEALVAEERRLWAILQEVSKTHQDATDAWHAVYEPLEKEKTLREARAEIEKEMAVAKADKQ
jgi:hypothetical protein